MNSALSPRCLGERNIWGEACCERLVVLRARPVAATGSGVPRWTRRDIGFRSVPRPAVGPAWTRSAALDEARVRDQPERGLRVVARLLEDHLTDLFTGPARRGEGRRPLLGVGQRAAGIS